MQQTHLVGRARAGVERRRLHEHFEDHLPSQCHTAVRHTVVVHSCRITAAKPLLYPLQPLQRLGRRRLWLGRCCRVLHSPIGLSRRPTWSGRLRCASAAAAEVSEWHRLVVPPSRTTPHVCVAVYPLPVAACRRYTIYSAGFHLVEAAHVLTRRAEHGIFVPLRVRPACTHHSLVPAATGQATADGSYTYTGTAPRLVSSILS